MATGDDFDNAERITREAIDQIVRDAKRAIQPHLDRLTQLKMMQAPEPLMIPDPGKSAATPGWLFDQPKAPTTFNLNNPVWIRLTDEGRALHRVWHTKRYPMLTYRPPEEINGWSRWQLWSLMQEFGETLYMGGRMPFDPSIALTKPADA